MRKKLSLLFIIVFSLINSAFAQNWGGGKDEEDFYWGFNFQYITSEYKITRAPNWRDPYFDKETGKFVTDKLNSISSPLTPGFGIGFVTNFKLSENFDIRFTPTIAFGDRVINYVYETPAVYNKESSAAQKIVQPASAEFPLGIKIKSDRRGNFRAYMLFGGKYSIDMASGKKAADAGASMLMKMLKNKKSYLAYEGAIGFDLYFEYFKMSPELKLSYSVTDLLKHEDHPYATPIEKAMLRNFTFSLFFE